MEDLALQVGVFCFIFSVLTIKKTKHFNNAVLQPTSVALNSLFSFESEPDEETPLNHTAPLCTIS